MEALNCKIKLANNMFYLFADILACNDFILLKKGIIVNVETLFVVKIRFWQIYIVSYVEYCIS